MIGRENGDVGRLAGGNFSFDAENSGGARGEKFDHAHERNLPGMNQFAEREGQRGFKADDAEGRAIEFNVLARGMMRRVVGSDGVHVAIGDAHNQRLAVVARSKRRIHFVIRVVANIVVAEREMVRCDFAGDAQPHSFRQAYVFERAGGGHARGPSRITPPAKREGSSQWSITGKSSVLQYSITWRIRRAVATGLPSSLTATIPASFIAAISARASPLLPMDTAPIGQTRTLPPAAARSTIPRVIEALSFTGCVFGMQQTAVKPPRAAARVPVSMVSDISWPGSRRWQCKSMKPGATIIPVASKRSASNVVKSGPTLTMRWPCKSTSCLASVFDAGSIRRPFLMSSNRSFLDGIVEPHCALSGAFSAAVFSTGAPPTRW